MPQWNFKIVNIVKGAIIFYREGGRLFVGGPEFFGEVKGGASFFQWANGGARIFRQRGDQIFTYVKNLG